MNFKERLEKFQMIIREKFDGAIISPGSNLFYLLGFTPSATMERPFFLIVPSAGETILLVPSLYKNELEKDKTKNIIIWEDHEDPYEKVAKIFQGIKNEKHKLLVEDSMPANFLINLEKVLDYQFEPLSTTIKDLRIRKTPEELSLLKSAANIADKVFEILLKEDFEGKKEKDISKRIEELIEELGGTGLSFDPIVASGPNSSNPHHSTGERKIEKGDFVVLDYGAKYNGYCSDITRTVSVGEPSNEGRRIYLIVKEAQEKAFMKVSKGVSASEIDKVAREYIKSQGYGDYFIHRTGHGIGLDVHEHPYITSSNNEVLDENMVFTIEPGIYIPNRFGVRIEDDIAIVNGRGVRLTNADRDLRVVK